MFHLHGRRYEGLEHLWLPMFNNNTGILTPVYYLVHTLEWNLYDYLLLFGKTVLNAHAHTHAHAHAHASHNDTNQTTTPHSPSPPAVPKPPPTRQ